MLQLSSFAIRHHPPTVTPEIDGIGIGSEIGGTGPVLVDPLGTPFIFALAKRSTLAIICILMRSASARLASSGRGRISHGRASKDWQSETGHQSNQRR